MLPKNRRIKRNDFHAILENSKRYNSPHILLYVSKNGLKPSNFSFSVSKKVLSKAVIRNKYRRWGYSIIRENIDKIKNGYSLFFSLKKGASEMDYKKMKKEIEELLSLSLMII